MPNLIIDQLRRDWKQQAAERGVPYQPAQPGQPRLAAHAVIDHLDVLEARMVRLYGNAGGQQ